MFSSNLPPLDLSQPRPTTNVRQSVDATSDGFTDPTGHYKYTRLIDRSPSIYSTASTNNNHELQQRQPHSSAGPTMVKSDSDQKIPDSATAGASSSGDMQFVYVNKNGFATRTNSAASPTDHHHSKKPKMDMTNLDPNPLLCTNILLEMYKNNKQVLTNTTTPDAKTTKANLSNQADRLSINRSVPSHEAMNRSLNSLNMSPDNSMMVQRDAHGNIIINTSMTIQEPNLDISYDHVKYVNIFSILCCWCFPITGIASIVYARLTKSHFNRRDLVRAKRYLDRSEWFLILTFFFGFTLISIGFCLLEFYWFKNDTTKNSHKTYQYHISRSLH